MVVLEFFLFLLLWLCFLVLFIFRLIVLLLLIIIILFLILIFDRDLDSFCVFFCELLDFFVRLGFFVIVCFMEERLVVCLRDWFGFFVELVVVLNLEVGEGCECCFIRGIDCVCIIIVDKFGILVWRKLLIGVFG